MEKLNDKQINVLRWWYSNRNYHAGLILLSRFSKNKVLLHTLMKPGKENIPAMQNKLSYELPKSVSLDWTNMPQLPEPANELPDTKDEERITEDVFHEIQEIKQYITEENPGQYPPIIIKIKYAYADLYKQRSLKHKELRNIPHTNTQENSSKRAR